MWDKNTNTLTRFSASICKFNRDVAPVEEEENGKPFRDILHEHSTWWTPIGKHDLLSCDKERERGEKISNDSQVRIRSSLVPSAWL